MALDTSIYQNLRPVQMEAPDFASAAKNALSLSQLAMQNRQLAQSSQEDEALRAAYANNLGPDGQVNRKGVLSALAKQAPMRAIALQGQWADQDAKMADAKQKQLSDHANQWGLTAQIAGLAKDQPSYDAAKKLAEAHGLDVSMLPPQYDPATIQKIQFMSAQQKERLDAAKGVSEMGINEAKAPLERAKTKADTRLATANAAKAESETPKPYLGKIEPSVDPAELVPHMVPKDQQAKVFEELKNAQDIRKMAPLLREAFERGSSRNPITAAQGQRAFEALIGTTVKEAEGSTRAAIFKSIHDNLAPVGTFATPGDNDSRWKAVEGYLASHSSAPMAKSHGIDLSKFDTTAQYKLPSKEEKGVDGVMGPKSAYSNDIKPPPPGKIAMVAPNGKVMYVLESQKGEAIAAGGKVFK